MWIWSDRQPPAESIWSPDTRKKSWILDDRDEWGQSAVSSDTCDEVFHDEGNAMDPCPVGNVGTSIEEVFVDEGLPILEAASNLPSCDIPDRSETPQDECGQHPGWIAALDEMLQDENDDIDRCLVEFEDARFERLIEDDWMPLLVETSQVQSSHLPVRPATSAVWPNTKERKRRSSSVAHPGRVFDNYCPFLQCLFQGKLEVHHIVAEPCSMFSLPHLPHIAASVSAPLS
jgi:hypothetical protein